MVQSRRSSRLNSDNTEMKNRPSARKNGGQRNLALIEDERFAPETPPFYQPCDDYLAA